MQTDPTARHSLSGPFQRVCYLAHAVARTHPSIVGELTSCMTSVRGQPGGPPTPGIAECLRERILETRSVHLQPGRPAVRPAATDRLATRSGSGSHRAWPECAHRAGVGNLHR
jgi:hypothetical protein